MAVYFQIIDLDCLWASTSIPIILLLSFSAAANAISILYILFFVSLAFAIV